MNKLTTDFRAFFFVAQGTEQQLQRVRIVYCVLPSHDLCEFFVSGSIQQIRIEMCTKYQANNRFHRRE